MIEIMSIGLWIIKRRLACFSHQIVDATQRVIGIVERVGQLVHPIVGLAVSIETHSYSRTVKKVRIRLNKLKTE